MICARDRWSSKRGAGPSFINSFSRYWAVYIIELGWFHGARRRRTFQVTDQELVQLYAFIVIDRLLFWVDITWCKQVAFSWYDQEKTELYGENQFR